jgi:hypothetical protein
MRTLTVKTLEKIYREHGNFLEFEARRQMLGGYVLVALDMATECERAVAVNGKPREARNFASLDELALFVGVHWPSATLQVGLWPED